jgi:hypothetical protein
MRASKRGRSFEPIHDAPGGTMLDRPSVLLALCAALALAVGFAVSFFELIILGVLLGIGSAVVWVRARQHRASA